MRGCECDAAATVQVPDRSPLFSVWLDPAAKEQLGLGFDDDPGAQPAPTDVITARPPSIARPPILGGGGKVAIVCR